jgi:AcrR family transcriptional regulator
MPAATKRRRVTRAADDRRRDLLDAAVKVFTHQGARGATIADITEAAGVAKGTFYLYFRSKEHVLGALRERFVQELMEHAAPFAERIGKADWWELADEVARTMVDWTLEHRDLILLVEKEAYTPETHQMIAECDRRLTTLMATGIQAGVEAGAFHTSDPALTGSFLYYGVIGTIVQAIVAGEELDRDRLVRAAGECGRKLLGR